MYPNQQGGYPTQQGGYPPQQGGFPPYQGGFPPQQGGYPPQQGGFPPQQGGYPPQQGGYPPQGGGYPQPQADIGFGSFDSQSQQGGYPPQQGGYPPQQGGYPPQQGGYPPQQEGYPPHQGGFPPHQGGFPPYQGGFPPQQGGYPPQQGGFPPQQGGYPPQGGDRPVYPGNPNPNSNSSFPPFDPHAVHSNPSLAQFSGGAGIYPNLQSGQRAMVYNPTVPEYLPFNPNDDATKLYKAMKGFGTDEATIIDVLCKRTSPQRQEILLAYKAGYGKDLVSNIKSEVSGNFERLLVAMMLTPAQLEARDLKNAIDGAGTDEDSLIDILCTKTNSQMIELKNAYKIMHKKDLEKDVGGDVSGYFKRFIVSLCAAFRSEAPPDHGKAVQQAKELYDAGAKRLGTDEVMFNRIFAIESFDHLKLVCDEYRSLTGKDIEQSIKSEMSGSVERAFLAVVGMAKNPPKYFAKRLGETMKGSGTHDRALMRNMILRSEIDMVQVKMEFQTKYGKSLESFIKGDCSGDYKRGLLCLAGDAGWR